MLTSISHCSSTLNKDPDEVLKSVDTSFLVITGNGTQLAPWDAKLGFQRLPFITTLNSLTPDGGLVVMTGVEVQNVFPIQYVETLPSGEKEMRSEEEESIARDRWEVSWRIVDHNSRSAINHSIWAETKGR